MTKEEWLLERKHFLLKRIKKNEIEILVLDVQIDADKESVDHIDDALYLIRLIRFCNTPNFFALTI